MAVHATPRIRTRSARRTLVILLLIPLVSLTALWGFTASITFSNVIRDDHYNTIDNTLAPSVIGLEETLAAERGLTFAWLKASRRSPQLRTQLLAARPATDKVDAEFRASTAAVRGLLSPTALAQQGKLLTALAGLPQLRAAVDSGTDNPATAFAAYDAIGSDLEEYLPDTQTPYDADPGLTQMTQSAVAVGRAEDYVNAAISLIEGAFAAHGQLSQPERTLFTQVVAVQNLDVTDTFALATPAESALFAHIFGTPAYRQLTAAENLIISSPADRPVPVRPAAFQATTKALGAAIVSTEAPTGELLAVQAARLSDSLRTQLYLAAGLGLLAVIVSLVVAVRFGRRLRQELTGLYESARQMADERLPWLVERLRRGDDVDVQAESPPPRTDRITEIASVARAFTAVQRTAVEAAVGQARLRKGVNQVFVSLSLRSQSLLHRQLSMLDDMERATSDPVALGDLFRLDHLTTRMRRHAEGLLILAGSTPGRGWIDPVPVADVLNAAVAEVEDYVRVDVVAESADAVAGTAVNDVIHLLAELVENATTFSPPHTRVEVRGESVGHGFAVEIEDRGLGMPEQEIAAINARLASPPEFDLANSDQLGLFVAARLAQRHGVRISLRHSPFGGMTAIVLLPPSIIMPADGAGWAPGVAGMGEPWPAAEAGPVNGSGGPVHDPRQQGSADHAPAFGLTGRHRRFGARPDPGTSPGPGLVPRPALPEPGFALPAPGPTAAPGPAHLDIPAPPWEWAAPPETPNEAPPAPAGGWFGVGQTTGGTGLSGSRPARTEFKAATPDGGRPGLPRRARGTNLAPQLRAKINSTAAPASREGARASAWPGAYAAHADEELPERSPEEASSQLSALQDGWERARTEDMNLDYFNGEDQ
jgi:signal transduction histidine kinase